MDSKKELLERITAAGSFIDKSYMNSLEKYQVIPIADHEKRLNLVRLFRIKK